MPDTGFPPIAAANARILILGSMPGQRSLAEQQYYAHPQNAFWRIMAELVAATGTYEQRCHALIANRIALWDVLLSSERPGSMDADIKVDTATPNDFSAFLETHPDVSRVCFNGRKAEQLFRRLVVGTLGDKRLELSGLPSTSPAHAAMAFEKKLEIWRSILCTPNNKSDK